MNGLSRGAILPETIIIGSHVFEGLHEVRDEIEA